MAVYYNEFDPKKAAALRQLIADGHISQGEVDERSIRDVQPGDLKGFTRCHFFAGIGLWEYALDLAGWPKDRPVWTGSCPCQPFSTAGRQKGKADDRHLWPEWLRLIRECRPPAIFGEQVASAVTHGWLDDVYQGLEAEKYALGAVVLPASAVGAPHRRERLWFVANPDSDSLRQKQIRQQRFSDQAKPSNDSESLANTKCIGPQGPGKLQRSLHTTASGEGKADRFNDDCSRRWENGIWVECPDGKQRLVEPGISLLADGYPERVGIIHCAGDAIVPQLAAEVIKATMNF